AAAALDAFADLLPGKSYRKARKVLKGLRRAAGSARDADVFLDSVRGWSVLRSPADRPGLYFLLGHAFARRQAAQADLASVIERAQAGGDADLDELPRKVREGKKEALGERAASALARLLHDLATAAGGDLDDYN